MSLESDFFKQKRFLNDKLLAYGFVKKENGYQYQTEIMNGDFVVTLKVSENGEISGRVSDRDLDEEYQALRILQAGGNYVGQVRSAYFNLLGNISDACCEDKLFSSDQANRLALHLMVEFLDTYDYPFEGSDTVSFRHPQNQKWYAVFINIARGKLDLGDEDWSKDDRKKQIVIANIKVPSHRLDWYLKHDGVYPAYHMGKKTWVSLVLDETLSDTLIQDWLQESRDLANGNLLKSEDGPDFWVIPANLKYYDIVKEFQEHKVILWTQKAAMKKGDYVCIYITAPTKAIIYLCRILEADILNEGYRDKKTIKTLMRIELIRTFSNQYKAEDLKKLGLTTVRGPRRLPKPLKEIMEKELL